jgi:hypothetical protein
MLLKSIISKKNLLVFAHLSVYLVSIAFLFVLVVFINENVYKTITANSEDLRDRINEAPKSINVKKFEEVLDRVNAKKNRSQIEIKEIF